MPSWTIYDAHTQQNQLCNGIGILSKYNVPIIMDADVGHFAPMMPLICGSYATIEVKGNQIEIEMK